MLRFFSRNLTRQFCCLIKPLKFWCFNPFTDSTRFVLRWEMIYIDFKPMTQHFFQDAAADNVLAAPERFHRRRSGSLETKSGQTFRRSWRVLHLLLHPTRVQSPVAQAGLQNLQEKVPLGLPLQVVLDKQQFNLPPVQKSVLEFSYGQRSKESQLFVCSAESLHPFEW